MAEVTTLSVSDDITVLGPPKIVEVQVDVGPTGNRGNKVFIGSGSPNGFTSNGVIFGQTLILNDLYINNFSGSSEYSYLYQYTSQPGGNTWIPVLKVNPTLYSGMHLTTYTNGTARIEIPLIDILDTTGVNLVADNFSIQYSLGHENPIASSISLISIGGSNSDQLLIDFVGSELSGGTWSNLDGILTTHIFITVVSSS
jgi:hypothetical protein